LKLLNNDVPFAGFQENLVCKNVFSTSCFFLSNASYNSLNNLRRDEMSAPSCFQAKRGLIGFGAAFSGKAPGIAAPTAFSRYKDLHRSLFSHFPLYHSSTSSYHALASSRIARVCAPLLLLGWLLTTVADRDALTLHQAFVITGDTSHPRPLLTCPLPSTAEASDSCALLFAASYLVARAAAAAQLEDDSFFDHVEAPRRSTLPL